MITRITNLSVLMLALAGSIGAQDEFKNIDGLINGMYSVISGPAAERDWEYFSSLFYPGATMGAFSPGPQGELSFVPMTPESYVEKNRPFFLEQGFWEEELGRDVRVFGELANVFSAYQFRVGQPDAPVARRGINSLQVVFEKGRWWILTLVWNHEREDLPLPEFR